MTDDEGLYRAHYLRADARRNLVVVAVLLLGHVLFVSNDFRFVEGAALGALLATRAVTVLASAAVVAVLVRSSSPRAHDRAIGVVLAVQVVAIMHIATTRPADFNGGAVANIVIVNIFYFILAGPVAMRSAAAIVVSLGSLWFLFRGSAAGAQKTTLAVTHILIQILGLTLAGRMERLRRDGFFAHLAEQRARRELADKARELERARDRAETLARTKSDFLAMMSHELRTPMNAVLGLSDVLETTSLSPAQRDLVRSIHGSARSLFVVLADVLALADIGGDRPLPEPAPFALRDVVRSAVDVVRHQSCDDARAVEVEVAPGVPEGLSGDALRVRQILVHLLSNALGVAGEGALVVEITARALGGGAHEVGFAVKGTGVGVTLRAREAELPPAGTRESRDSLAAQRDLRVLVVDDNALNREVALALLGRLGLAADVAGSGEEALSAIERKQYDLILMDLLMPGMNGLETTRRLFAAHPEASRPRVVALSASTLASDRAACVDVGMAGFLGKPLHIEELRAVLEAMATMEPAGGAPPGAGDAGAARPSPVAAERGPAAPLAPGAASPAPSPRPKLDPAALALLRELSTPEAPDFFETVCRRFLADAGDRLDRLESAAASGDAETAGREAHTLKTASATVGAWEMSAACASLESTARRGELSGHAAAVAALRAELALVEQALSEATGGGL